MKTKQVKKLSINKRNEQVAWDMVVMSIAAISEVETQYESKRVILEFQDIMGMIDFLHLTDIILAAASMGKIAAERV